MSDRVRVRRREDEPDQREEPAAGPTPAPQPRTSTDVLGLQRSAGNAAVARVLGRLVTDQHKDAKEPDSGQLAAIETELNPTAPPVKGAPAPTWDGDPSNKDFVKNRAALKKALTQAVIDHLDAVMPDITAQSKAPKLPMTSFEGAGRAAKQAVDAKFGSYTSAAALTGPQQHARASFSFKAGTNLLDITDPSVYTPNPADVVDWIAQTDPAAQAAAKAHNFNKDRSGTPERSWLNSQVIAPIANGPRRKDLALYDKFGFAMAPTDSTVIVAPTLVGSKQFPATAPATGGPSPAERRARWNMWELLVHEYIHTLEHPAFVKSRGSNRILFEGFCEMFTEDVLSEWIPKAQADSDPALRKEVEGADPKGALWPGFTKDLVADYDAGSYADYAKHAKQIRTILGGGGDNSVRAAFFQGHVEFVGLKPGGGMASPAAHGPSEVEVPKGVSDWTTLATMTGVDAKTLSWDNPLTFTPLPGDWIWARGCRYHRVVASTGRSAAPAGGTVTAVETIDQIATQNGVAPADLKRANPGVDFAKLKAGDRVLIPRH